LAENKDSLEECADANHEIVLDPMKGEYVCIKCGVVLSKEFVPPSYQINPRETRDPGNSGRQFVALGDSTSLVDGLGSFMGFQFESYFQDKNGRPLPSAKQTLFKRLKYYHDLPARIAKREPEFRALMTLHRIFGLLDPMNANIKESAAYLYQKFRKNLEKGEVSNHLNILAACIYLAVKEAKSHSTLTIKEIAGAFQTLHYQITAKSILRTALTIKPKGKDLFHLKTSRSEDYLSKIITKIISTPEIKTQLLSAHRTEFEYERVLLAQSRLILQQIPDEARGGRNPYILAVATIYASDKILSIIRGSKPILTQHLLAIITDTVKDSMREHWRWLLSMLNKMR